MPQDLMNPLTTDVVLSTLPDDLPRLLDDTTTPSDGTDPPTTDPAASTDQPVDFPTVLTDDDIFVFSQLSTSVVDDNHGWTYDWTPNFEETEIFTQAHHLTSAEALYFDAVLSSGSSSYHNNPDAMQQTAGQAYHDIQVDRGLGDARNYTDDVIMNGHGH